jgi:hypothetical protein
MSIQCHPSSMVGVQQQWRKLVPEQILLIRGVTLRSPAFNRARTLCKTCMYPIHSFLLPCKQKKAKHISPLFIVLPLLVFACNCYIPSRKINHRGVLLHALILSPYVQDSLFIPNTLYPVLAIRCSLSV